MIALGVNIDHVATLRQARRTIYPEPLLAALEAEAAGADAITLHLREDRRHIQDADVSAIRARLRVRTNLEMAATDEMVKVALEVRPHDVCLVPERREELTTEGGLDVSGGLERLRTVCARLAAGGIRVSLFIDADPRQIEAAGKCGAPVIEIHTGHYADAVTPVQREAELDRVRAAASQARSLGLVVNAGHGLHYDNVRAIAAIPGMAELNIGHAIVARAVFVGMREAVRDMKALINEGAA